MLIYSLGFCESLKNKALFLPGEAAVQRSVVSVRQPAEPALLAVLLPALPTCSKRKEKLAQQATRNKRKFTQHATKENQRRFSAIIMGAS